MAAIQREIVSENFRDKGGRTGQEGALGLGACKGPAESVSDTEASEVGYAWLENRRFTGWTWEERLTEPWKMCRN